jgi:hypothetical protein
VPKIGLTPLLASVFCVPELDEGPVGAAELPAAGLAPLLASFLGAPD